MASITAESDKAGWRLPLPLAAFLALYLLLLLAGGKLLNDADAYWHLVVGRWIVENGAFPAADPFSWTMRGTPWIAKEWLSQLLFAAAHALAGWTGMVMLTAGAVALAFALLAQRLSRALAPLPVIAFLAVAFILAAPHLVARPHVLALPVLVLWMGGLLAASGEGRAPPFILLPLMTLWANLHGGFSLGLALVAPVALEALLASKPEARFRTAVLWGGFFLAALLAAMITPYGPQTILAAYKVLSLGAAQGVVDEWRPQDFSRLGAFEIVLLLGIGGALLAGVRLPLMRVVMLAGLLHQALAHSRNADFLGVVAPLLMAVPLARQFPELRSESAPASRTAKLAAALAILVTTVLAGAALRYEPARNISPVAATEALKRERVTRVLNAYDFGGYLIFAGVPTYIDGRTELYGGAFTAAYQDAVTLRDPQGLAAILEKNRIEAVLMPPFMPAVGYLDASPDWRRVYADDIAILHVRRTAAPVSPRS